MCWLIFQIEPLNYWLRSEKHTDVWTYVSPTETLMLMFLQLKIKQSCAAPLHHNMRITSHCRVLWTFPHITVFNSHWCTFIYIFMKTKEKEKGRTNKQNEKNKKPAVSITKHRWLQWSYLSCVAFFQNILSSCRRAPSLPWVRMLCRLQRGVFCPCRRLMLCHAFHMHAPCPVTAPLIWTPANLQEPSFRSWRLRSVVKTHLKLCWSVKHLMSPSTRFCQSNVSGRCKILTLAIKVRVDMSGYYFVSDVITEARTHSSSEIDQKTFLTIDGISGSF